MNTSNPPSLWLRALPALNRFKSQPAARLDLIGLDMAPARRIRRQQTLVPGIAAVVIAALFLVGLRMDVVRMRYARTEAAKLEARLLEEQRSITVALLRLREPKLLSQHAARLGFTKPDRVISLASTSQARAAAAAGPRP